MVRLHTEPYLVRPGLVCYYRSMVINVYEAKTQLSKLLDRAAGGEEIILGKSGKPLARLVPYRERRSPRRPGRLAGKIEMADDFDETPGWLIEAVEGNA